MGKETKSNGQKDILDRFYTPSTTITKCLELIDFTQYDCIIEPSAGSGNFIAQFPSDVDVYGFDIKPEAEGIKEIDWFLVDKTQFNKYKSILVCGNPPFGQQNSLAIDFFNESAKFCNTIAFILPLSFKKDSIQNRLDLEFHLVDEIILDNCEFLLKNEDIIYDPSLAIITIKNIYKKRYKQLKEIKNKDVINYLKENNKPIIYITVANAISLDCDCDALQGTAMFESMTTNLLYTLGDSNAF